MMWRTGTAEAARKRFQELKEEMKQLHDKLAQVRERSRSRTGTPEPAATVSGDPMYSDASLSGCLYSLVCLVSWIGYFPLPVNVT